MAWSDVNKLCYTQATLSDSAARSCFEKARYFWSLKIHKKLGFQPDAKIFVAFFLTPYRDCTNKNILGGYRHFNFLLLLVDNQLL